MKHKRKAIAAGAVSTIALGTYIFYPSAPTHDPAIQFLLDNGITVSELVQSQRIEKATGRPFNPLALKNMQNTQGHLNEFIEGTLRKVILGGE